MNTINTLDTIYHKLCQGDVLVQSMIDNYFMHNEEYFEQSALEKEKFICNYDNISTLLSIVSDILYEIRVTSEFALGLDTRLTRAYRDINNDMIGNNVVA